MTPADAEQPPPPAVAARRRRTPLGGIAAGWLYVCAGTGGAGGAFAQGLGSDGGSREGTIARQDMLRTWDNAKRYGAEAVADRSRLDFVPSGIDLGASYVLQPSASSRVIYDDNVYATARNKKADVILEANPEVRLRSRLPRHVLDFAMGARITQYAREEELNSIGGFGAIDGAIHIDHAHTLSVSLLSDLDHEDRLAPDAATDAAERTPVWRNRASVGLKRDAGRIWVGAGVTAESWDYKDVRARDGSTIDQDARDSQMLSGDLRGGYRISPATEVQARVRLLRQQMGVSGGIDRDNTGYEALAGLASELSPLLRWRIAGGYGVRDWDDGSLANTGRTIAEAEVEWLATPLVTVYATLRRAIEDGSSGIDYLGRLDNSAKVRLDYEAMRNLVFTFAAEYRDSEYLGTDRRDRLAVGRIGVDWLLDRNWTVSLGYERTERMSSDDDADLSRNRVWAGVRLRF